MIATKGHQCMYNHAQHIHRGRHPQMLKSPTEMFIYVVGGGGWSIMDRWGVIMDIFPDGGLIIPLNDSKKRKPMHVQSCPTHPPRSTTSNVEIPYRHVHLCGCGWGGFNYGQMGVHCGHFSQRGVDNTLK